MPRKSAPAPADATPPRATAARDPDATRRRILEAAFLEFRLHGFQGASLADIVAAAGTTKGALFHHFDGKFPLGYAVFDEIITPLIDTRWLYPVRDTADPIAALQHAFRRAVRDDIRSGDYVLGCPLNNVAQEMSPLDAGFHGRTAAIYRRWRSAYGTALRRGIGEGTVARDAAPGPDRAAALIVAAEMGIWGSAKSARDPTLMRQACDALCDFLDGLRPARN